MKVILLSPLPPPAGGVATWTTLYMNSRVAKKNKIDLVNTAIIGKRSKFLNEKNYFTEVQRTLNIFKKFIQLIVTSHYDIVHINTSCSFLGMLRDWLLARMAKFRGIKIIVHFHCDTNSMIKNNFSKFVFAKLCNIADARFTLNVSSYTHMKKSTDKESVFVPNFIEAELLDLEKNRIISEQVKNIVYIGHLSEEKGIKEVLEVAEKMPFIEFKLYGPIRCEVDELKLTDNVRIFGPVSRKDVMRIMLEADILLFPSHAEGFPNTILEAMTCGLPIVATSVGAIPDMIEDYKGGIITKVGDVEGMINAIIKMQKKEIREPMSKWSQDKVKNNYTVDIVVKRIFDIYDR